MQQSISLDGCKVINDRAENLGVNPDYRAKHDIVLSRAVSKLSPNLETAIPLLKNNGIALIYKTEKFAVNEDELKAVGNALEILGAGLCDRFFYKIPTEPEKYCIMVFRKIFSTPRSTRGAPGSLKKNRFNTLLFLNQRSAAGSSYTRILHQV